MEFLGKLGIDLNLLIAQIINFGLLLFLLNRFIYKPMVAMIEKDEAQLEEAKKQEIELEKAKAAFEQTKAKELKAAEVKAQQIISEATTIAKTKRQEIQKDASKQADLLLKRSEVKIERQKDDLIAKYKKQAQKEIDLQVEKYLRGSMTEAIRRAFQRKYLNDLGQKIKKFSFASSLQNSIMRIMENFSEQLAKEKQQTKKIKEIEAQLQKTIADKIGPVILQTAWPLTAEEHDQLVKIITAKAGVLPKIEIKLNKNLLAGFNLEFFGILFEANLITDINNERENH